MAVYTNRGGEKLSFRLPEPYLQLLMASRLDSNKSLHVTARDVLMSALISTDFREVLVKLVALEKDLAQLRLDLQEGFALLLGAVQSGSDKTHAKRVFAATFASRSAN